MIIGNPRSSKSAGTYVRLPDEAHALLVKGRLELAANPMEWLVKDVAHIPSERIREVVIQEPGQAAVRVYKNDPKDADYTLDALPKGHKVKSQLTVNSLATSLEYPRFDDVAPRADLKLPANPTVTTLRTFDGLVAIVKSAIVKDKTWAQVEFSFDAEAAKKTAANKPASRNARQVQKPRKDKTTRSIGRRGGQSAKRKNRAGCQVTRAIF
ncbi:MAG: DUF4340 domain-containing protein [Gammaproteobacteria bacterium]